MEVGSKEGGESKVCGGGRGVGESKLGFHLPQTELRGHEWMVSRRGGGRPADTGGEEI